MDDRELVRRGTYILRHWKFYELNIDQIKGTFRERQALMFFKVLQEMNKEELQLLAMMYYRNPTQNYNKWYSAFETCKAADLEEVAEQTGKTIK